MMTLITAAEETIISTVLLSISKFDWHTVTAGQTGGWHTGLEDDFSLVSQFTLPLSFPHLCSLREQVLAVGGTSRGQTQRESASETETHFSCQAPHRYALLAVFFSRVLPLPQHNNFIMKIEDYFHLCHFLVSG